MASQIMYFEKSKCDISNPLVSITASQGATTARYALNRNNYSAWLTTASMDADNTTLEVNFGEEQDISSIVLIEHNFKSFKVEYWNGAAYVAMPTPIDVTNSQETTSWFQFQKTKTEKLKLTVRGTKTANQDKQLFQFIATNKIGQFEGWPKINNPVHTRNRKINKMLSGKSSITENLGAFSFDIAVPNWRSDVDLTILERLYNYGDAFLVWLCGGDESQFSSQRTGYRRQDFYLMRCANDYEPEWAGGIYSSGLNIKVKFVEVVD